MLPKAPGAAAAVQAADGLVPLYDSTLDYSVQSDQPIDASVGFIMRLKVGRRNARMSREQQAARPLPAPTAPSLPS